MPVFDDKFAIFDFSIFDFRSEICDLNMMPENAKCREDEKLLTKSNPLFPIRKKYSAFPCIPLDKDVGAFSRGEAAGRFGNTWGLKVWRGRQGGRLDHGVHPVLCFMFDRMEMRSSFVLAAAVSSCAVKNI